VPGRRMTESAGRGGAGAPEPEPKDQARGVWGVSPQVSFLQGMGAEQRGSDAQQTWLRSNALLES